MRLSKRFPNKCLRHELAGLLATVARWFPPSRMTPPISEDNPRDLDWKSQRTTGPESPKVLKNLKKDEDEDKEIEFELKRKRKKKDKIRRLEPDDYYEYGASFLPSNRYNESQFGPSYGNPDFHGTIDAKARALLKAVGCTCNI